MGRLIRSGYWERLTARRSAWATSPTARGGEHGLARSGYGEVRAQDRQGTNTANPRETGPPTSSPGRPLTWVPHALDVRALSASPGRNGLGARRAPRGPCPMSPSTSSPASRGCQVPCYWNVPILPAGPPTGSWPGPTCGRRVFRPWLDLRRQARGVGRKRCCRGAAMRGARACSTGTTPCRGEDFARPAPANGMVASPN
jgi:hypothetical protein